MLVWRDDELLLIERKKYPFGFALPAGHVDADATYEAAAIRELREEVGLVATNVKLIAEARKENPCRREDGSWHMWKLYEVVASGDVVPAVDEAKQADWYSREDLAKLARRTEQYLKKEISEDEWVANPGLEPIMYDWFIELHIISRA